MPSTGNDPGERRARVPASDLSISLTLVWDVLDLEDRAEVAEPLCCGQLVESHALLLDIARRQLVDRVSELMPGTRTSVLAVPGDEIAWWAAMIDDLDDALVLAMFTAWTEAYCSRSVRTLQHDLGLPGAGLPQLLDPGMPPPATQDLLAAVESARRAAAREPVDKLLLLLRLGGPGFWRGLDALLDDGDRALLSGDRPPRPAPPSDREELEALSRLREVLGKPVVEIDEPLPADAIADVVAHMKGSVEAGAAPAASPSNAVRGLLAALGGGGSAPKDRRERSWYWLGVLVGHQLRDGAALLVRFADEQRSELRRLLAPAFPAAEVVSVLVARGYLRASRTSDASTFLTVAGLRASPRLGHEAVSHAGALLREGALPSASQLLDRIEALLPELETSLGGAAPFRRALRRRRAHCLRLAGDLDQARTVLEQLLEEDLPADLRADILADLGLIACGLRSLADIRLPARSADLASLAQTLEPGRSRFEEAAAIPYPQKARRHGELCLGLLAFARGDRGGAVPLLQAAVESMERAPDYYRRLPCTDQGRFFLGMALAERGDAASASRASSLLTASLALGKTMPQDLLATAIELISVEDESLGHQLAEASLARLGNSFVDHLALHEVGRRVAKVVDVLRSRAADRGRARSLRFAAATPLVKAARERGDRELWDQSLSLLEEIAAQPPELDAFLALLDDRKVWDPCWTRDEALGAQIRLSLDAGRADAAAAYLARFGHGVLVRIENGDDDPGLLYQARATIEHLTSIGAADAAAPLERHLRAIEGRMTAPAPRAAPPVQPRGTVLFVGGHEAQARYDERILAEARARWPQVRLVLRHPGWSSNWGRELADLERDLDQADALVLMKFMRTHLGRRLRKACDSRRVRWVSCSGHGLGSLMLAIEEAPRLQR